MRCERCGAILDKKIIKFNGTLLCENCAKELGVEDAFKSAGSFMGAAFPLFDGLTEAMMGSGSDLDFANTKLCCPRCGSSLRDVESTGKVGCIECYNTFSDIVAKKLLRKQGSNEYYGRTPGVPSTGIGETNATAAANETPVVPAEKPAAKEEPKDSTKDLEKVKKADLGMMSDKDLQDAMQSAIEAEDYLLAARLRDEIKGRTGGN